jgi:hypothetical protein
MAGSLKLKDNKRRLNLRQFFNLGRQVVGVAGTAELVPTRGFEPRIY